MVWHCCEFWFWVAVVAVAFVGMWFLFAVVSFVLAGLLWLLGFLGVELCGLLWVWAVLLIGCFRGVGFCVAAIS